MAWFNQNKPQQNNTDYETVDNRIDPNRYADLLIRQVLTCVSGAVEAGKSLKEAFSVYTLNVQTLESICYANNWIEGKIEERYQECQTKYLADKKIENTTDMDENSTYHFHRVKFQFLLKEIFGNQMKYLEMEI